MKLNCILFTFLILSKTFQNLLVRHDSAKLGLHNKEKKSNEQVECIG